MSNQNLYQLFHEVPDDDTMRDLFAVFNIPFPLCEEQRLDPWILKEDEIVAKMQEITPILSLQQIPCKANTYLNKTLRLKNTITVLRHFCRVKGYNTKIVEIQINNRKMRTYIISPPKSQFVRSTRQITFD